MRFLILFLLALSVVPAFSQAPQVPENLTVMATGGTTASVTWSASADATGYVVYRDDVDVSGTVTSLSFNDNGLIPGATYSYKVQAFTGTFGSGQSPAVMVTMPTPPPVPTGLRGSATTDGVVLNWNAAGGADEYFVFRDGTEIANPTGTTFTDADVDPSTTYKYSVSSANAAGESDMSAEITVTTKGDGSTRAAVWGREFRRADANYDEIVTFDEYLIAFPNKLAWTIMRNRFLGTDDDGSLDLTVDEYINHFAGKVIKRPSKAQAFFLADTAEIDREFPEDEDDGLLSVEEFALTLNRGTKDAKVTKKFNKLDKNGSGQLSQVEFKIRGGTSEDDL